MGERCTGDCCRSFPLGHSPEEMAANYRAWRSKGKGPIINDIFLIWPMIRHLGFFDKNPTAPEKGSTSGEHYYSCIHLNDFGDCGIYEDRPAMCRDYPYGIKCQYPGCEWDDAEKKTSPRPVKPTGDNAAK